VPLQRVYCIEESEELLCVVIDIRLDQWGPKATTVYSVVDQESGAGGTHGDELRVILALHDVRRVLFHLVCIMRGA
jgi:hypothetical protein